MQAGQAADACWQVLDAVAAVQAEAREGGQVLQAAVWQARETRALLQVQLLQLIKHRYGCREAVHLAVRDVEGGELRELEQGVGQGDQEAVTDAQTAEVCKPDAS